MTMEGAATTSLLASAVKVVELAQVPQDLFHADLLAQEREVHAGPGSRCCRRGWLDGRVHSLYACVSRGDHFLGGNFPFVAHGFIVGAVRLRDRRLGGSRR